MDTEPVASAVAAEGIGRRGVLTAGVGAALALATLTEEASIAAAANSSWRWCFKCRGLFAGQGKKSVGVCPDGGAHKPRPVDIYVLLSDLGSENAELDKFWFRCQKCRGMFANNAGNTGDCPKGAAHAPTGPAHALWRGAAAIPFMEAGWDQCLKCSGLVWVNAQNGFGVCPAGGTHQAKGLNYKLIRIW
jgi:hypothetical protein